MGLMLWWKPFNADDVETMKELIAAGKLKPVIDRRFELDEVIEALRHVDEGRAKGKSRHHGAGASLVDRDGDGFLLCGYDYALRLPPGGPLGRRPYPLETLVPGVFVAGDVRRGSVRRLVSAAGEGATAGHFVHRYIRDTPGLASVAGNVEQQVG